MNAFTNDDMTRLLRHRPDEQARALDVDGVGPPARPRLPRVLRRARRRLRGAPPARRSRRRPASSTRRSRRCSGTAHPYSWPVVGWPSDIPAITKAQADDVLRALLRAEQHHRDPRRRLRPEGGPRPRRALLRAGFRAGRTRRPRSSRLPPKWDAEMRMNGEAETNPAGRDLLAHRPLPEPGQLRAGDPGAAS